MQRGVLLCGTGLGMSYAANRHPGVRAAVVWTPEIARLARQHNDANVLVLPSRCIDDGTAREILRDLAQHAVRGRPPRQAHRQDRERGVTHGLVHDAPLAAGRSGDRAS